MGIFVDTYGTAKVEMTDGEIANKVSKLFDMRPYAIEQRLKLRNPIYQRAAAYGHMGRESYNETINFTNAQGTTISKDVEFFTLEKLDLVDQVKEAFVL